MRLNSPCEGFTLLEILVVLAITAIISMLMIQGYSQMLLMRARFLQSTESHRADHLREAWFRDTVSAITLTLPDREQPFEGASDHLRGISTQPLAAISGAPAVIEWTLQPLEDAFSLDYHEPQRNQGWEVMRLPAPAKFRFRDQEGKWHENWPPQDQESPRLPDLVELSGTQNNSEFRWLAPILGQKEPRLDLNSAF